MPMIATTIINSIRVKPCCMVLIGHSLIGHQYWRRSPSYATPVPAETGAREASKAARSDARWSIFVGRCPTLSAVTFAPPAESGLVDTDVLAHAPLARDGVVCEDAAAPFTPEFRRRRADHIELLARVAAQLEDEFLAGLATEPVLPDASSIAYVIDTDVPALLERNEIARRRSLQRHALPRRRSRYRELAKQRRRDVHLRGGMWLG